MDNVSSPTQTQTVFSYKAIRGLAGAVALSIPFIVTIASQEPIASISGSYYTDARDWFVGLLFMNAAFLFAYKGHNNTQKYLSRIAAVAAVCVALFPTTQSACEIENPDSLLNCAPDWVSTVHYVSAGALFSILTYFCFFIFYRSTAETPYKSASKPSVKRSSDEARRHLVYLACSVTMLACMLGLVLVAFGLFAQISNIVYYLEALALIAFGIAWTVSGKFIPGLRESR